MTGRKLIRAFLSFFFFATLTVPVEASAQNSDIEEAEITKLPEIIEATEATFPPRAFQARVGALVELEIEISETGTVSDAVVVQTTTLPETLSATVAQAHGIVRSSTTAQYAFDVAALDAVRRMRFSPAEAEGTPIPVRVPFTYTFELPPLPPLPSTSAQAPQQLSLRGILRERGTRKRIAGALVTVFEVSETSSVSGFEATSNAEGVFEFFDLSPGAWRIQGETDGYFPLRDTLEITSGELTEVTYYLEKGSYSPYDVVVRADRIKREISRRTLTREEIRTVAGTLGDPILVVENLPGVARPAAGSGNIIVRGSGTADTRVYIDAVQVPLIYHFGGLKSVLPIDIVDSVDFYPGNFSVYYGRGTGGVFDAHVRRLNPDQIHGTVEVSALDISLFTEAPLGKNAAFAIGGRRSIIGDVINAVVPDDANAGVIAAPVYYDGQFILNWQPKPEHLFRVFLLASDDTLELLFQNPADLDPQLANGQVSTSVNFQRATLEYQFSPSENFQNTTILAAGRNFIDFAAFNFDFDLESLQILFRNTTRWKLSEQLAFRAGLDVIGSKTDVSARLPGGPVTEGQTGTNLDLSDPIVANIRDFFDLEFGGFVEAEWRPFKRLLLVPGVRFDYFDIANQWSADPRIVAELKLLERLSIKAGVGVVYQPPLPQDVIRPFGNPDAGLQRGIQYSLGTEFGFPEKLGFLKNVTVDLTFFYKDLNSLITASDLRDDNGDPLFVANTAIGRVYGLETFIEHKFANNFRGWVSYTLSRSERRDRPNEDFRLFDFDQTHIFNMNASYVLPEGWEIGARLRLISGNPFTPSLVVQNGQTFFIDDIDQFSNIPGEVNSGRLPLFAQLDLRVEKSWVFNVFRFKAFLSIINTWNRENVEGFSFNFDFTQQDFVSSLPVFPNIGFRAEF